MSLYDPENPQHQTYLSRWRAASNRHETYGPPTRQQAMFAALRARQIYGTPLPDDRIFMTSAMRAGEAA